MCQRQCCIHEASFLFSSRHKTRPHCSESSEVSWSHMTELWLVECEQKWCKSLLDVAPEPPMSSHCSPSLSSLGCDVSKKWALLVSNILLAKYRGLVTAVILINKYSSLVFRKVYQVPMRKLAWPIPRHTHTQNVNYMGFGFKVDANYTLIFEAENLGHIFVEKYLFLKPSSCFPSWNTNLLCGAVLFPPTFVAW